MTFSVYGHVAQLPVTVTWQDGHLDGPIMVTHRISELVRSGKPVWATPAGPSWPPDLQVPHVALLLIRDALDTLEGVVGEVPPVPGLTSPPDTDQNC